MLTLSDEIKIHVDHLSADVGTSVGYDLYIYDNLIYRGTLYYTGATDIYIKAIIETYITEVILNSNYFSRFLNYNIIREFVVIFTNQHRKWCVGSVY